MFRKIINWLLYTLGFKKKEHKDAVVSLMDTMALMLGMIAIIGVMKSFGPFPKQPWYRRILFRVKLFFMRSRAILIGY